FAAASQPFQPKHTDERHPLKIKIALAHCVNTAVLTRSTSQKLLQMRMTFNPFSAKYIGLLGKKAMYP
ncbi:MAG: hypothetical protein AAGA72_12910, partial [Pseudomonadota bacterium]